jgi:asparagine synthase (glutamine-hydrolysing)
MCGIAGYFRPQGEADLGSLAAMNDRIRHRGPDEDGYGLHGGCGLGMRRLSIVDVAGGRQPVASEDGRIETVFNGEIYNYKELRRDLEARGHRFRTHTDTETIVHAFEEEGVECWRRLRGMFAIALWDEGKRTLTLARDRFGKKPLYYCARPEGLYFASELKCFDALGLRFEADPEALSLYFFLRYIPTPRSVYREIRQVPPGGWLQYDAAGRVREGIYWKVPEASLDAGPGFDRAAAARRLREKFDESVALRRVAEVPLGAFLSGGVDSGAVVAAMASQADGPVKTFSIGFAEAEFNELDAARRVARRYGTEHHEIEVTPDSVSLVEEIVSFLDEPFADTSVIPMFIVSRFAREHVKVVLSGDGGDELFCGYDSFFLLEKLRRFDAVPRWLRTAAGWAAGALPYSAPGKNYLRMVSRRTPLERYFDFNHIPYELRRRLVSEPYRLAAEADAAWRETFAWALPAPGRDVLAEAIYFEATAKLSGDMLVKVDRMSMANSIEVRSPLLDHELAEVAFSLPAREQMRNGKGKALFLEAIGDRLPRENLTLPKKGFGVPLAAWFRGPLRSYAHDLLLSRRFLERELVQEGFLRYLLEEHDSGRRDNYQLLWQLLMLEGWFRGRS